MDYKARFYSPYLNHFIQPDTVTPGGPQGLNRYSYVSNNPINFNDPTGHMMVGDDDMSKGCIIKAGCNTKDKRDEGKYKNSGKNNGNNPSVDLILQNGLGQNSCNAYACTANSGSNTSVKYGPFSCPVQECQYTIPLPEEYGWDWGAYYYNNKTSVGYSVLNPAGPDITVSNEGIGVYNLGFGFDRNYDYTTFEYSTNHNGAQSNLSFGVGASAEDLSVNFFAESSSSIERNNYSGSASTRQEFGVRPIISVLVFAAVTTAYIMGNLEPVMRILPVR